MDALQAMRIFARVVETGSFTRAAELLGLPKGTVTKQVQALEARLQVKLLNRSTRRVAVTVDGAGYYERAARLLADFDDIEAGMAKAQASPKGRLRIDVGAAMATAVLLPALCGFSKRYPDIQLEMGVSDRPVDLVGDGVDCVIRAGTLRDQSLVARRIGNLAFVTVAAPAYVERHGLPAHPRDLEGPLHATVGYFSGAGRALYPMEFRRGAESVALAGTPRVAVNDSNAHTAALLGGFGIAQTTAFVATPHLASGALVRMLPDWDGQSLPVHVVYPPNRHLSPRVRVFVDWVAELFAGEPLLQGRLPG